jgi:hypothetical protein
MLTLTLRVTKKHDFPSMKIKTPSLVLWTSLLIPLERVVWTMQKYERNKRCHAKEA